MIFAFALEPRLVATWGRREGFRFVRDKFGLGTPRALLEFPAFGDWKAAVYDAAGELELSEKDWKRLEELFKLFGEHKCRRVDWVYVEMLTWLENAEREHDRRAFAAIVATENPRSHRAVILGDELGSAKARRWTCDTSAMPSRTAEGLTAALSAMLINCRVLHLVDPYFGPDSPGHRRVLEALMDELATHGVSPGIIRVHCSARADLEHFEREAARMALRLPAGIAIEFSRWRERVGGEKLHNRYVLTELGGVLLGVGLDAGVPGETDDVHLLSRAQYERRWAQYVTDDGSLERVDMPAAIRGARATGRSREDR